jgi:hypothetical protein
MTGVVPRPAGPTGDAAVRMSTCVVMVVSFVAMTISAACGTRIESRIFMTSAFAACVALNTLHAKRSVITLIVALFARHT